MEAFFPLLITFGLMWLLLIRPQQRRVRAHRAVVASLGPGDEVITAGGIHGTIVAVDDETVQVEVAPGVTLRFLRSSVTQRVATGADEADDAQDGDADDAPASDAGSGAAPANDET